MWKTTSVDEENRKGLPRLRWMKAKKDARDARLEKQGQGQKAMEETHYAISTLQYKEHMNCKILKTIKQFGEQCRNFGDASKAITSIVLTS